LWKTTQTHLFLLCFLQNAGPKLILLALLLLASLFLLLVLPTFRGPLAADGGHTLLFGLHNSNLQLLFSILGPQPVGHGRQKKTPLFSSCGHYSSHGS
jgi:hypothetical protein